MQKSGSECLNVVNTAPGFNHLPLARGTKVQNCAALERGEEPVRN